VLQEFLRHDGIRVFGHDIRRKAPGLCHGIDFGRLSKNLKVEQTNDQNYMSQSLDLLSS
jgi:hypothetical protein